MSTLVRYAQGCEEERLLDLAKLNAADFALISSLHGQIGRKDRILLCQQALERESRDGGGDDGAAMYIKKIRDRYWAVHFPGSDCAAEHAVEHESDEHRYQKDYWQRAAEDAGFSVTQERSTGHGTILDVAIEGPRRTGIEVQRSSIQTRSVKARTTKSFHGGWLPVWFLDSDRPSPWFFEVPTVGSNPRPWSSMPPRRAATAIGPRRLVATRCTIANMDTCPVTAGKKPKRPCGRFHPIPEPWGGLTVDDVAGMVPAREIVPIRDLRGNVRLIPHSDLELFRELTGTLGEYEPDTRARRGGRAPRTTACANPHTPQDLAVEVKMCSKCGRSSAGPGGVLCLRCYDAIAGLPARVSYDLARPPRN
ncbi:hypothetical protein ACIBCH_33140 [Amycolatopsis thailandensis]|uniref:hypothetical protein n=1 Tax=Amycolatopsis thailandensis TaxID=589330 RepID=UPI00379C09F2